MIESTFSARWHRARWALAVLLTLASPATLHAHIRLEASTPARDETVTAAPAYLRLLFSAHIEARYTSVELVAPDGSLVPHGGVTFVDGSDREITVVIPPLERSGTYTVRWRTAGADGHVLEGTYSFVLALSEQTAVDTALQAEPAPPDATAATGHDHHDEPDSVGGPKEVIARGLHFLALLLLVGSLAFRMFVLPRLDISVETHAILVRRMWRTLATAAVLLAVAAVLRLWFQSLALHGAERAWSTPLLSIMLRDTTWGRAWVIQAFLFAVLGMAIVWAGPRRDRTALLFAVPAAAGLAAIPALSGHAAAMEGVTQQLAIANDALHVASAGAWLGMLAIVMLVAIPVLRRRESHNAAADAIDRFSPVALASAAIVAVTGVINTLMHVSSPAQLFTTDYGRTLLFKIAFVACVIIAGFINWRIVRPRLRDGDQAKRLNVSAAFELLFAALVLAATAVLTGQPLP